MTMCLIYTSLMCMHGGCVQIHEQINLMKDAMRYGLASHRLSIVSKSIVSDLTRREILITARDSAADSLYGQSWRHSSLHLYKSVFRTHDPAVYSQILRYEEQAYCWACLQLLGRFCWVSFCSSDWTSACSMCFVSRRPTARHNEVGLTDPTHLQ